MNGDSLHRADCGDSGGLSVPSQKSHASCKNDPATYKGTKCGDLQIFLIIHSSLVDFAQAAESSLQKKLLRET